MEFQPELLARKKGKKKSCFIYMLKGTTSSLWAADKQPWWGRKRKGTVHHSGKGEGGRERSKDTSKEIFLICHSRGGDCRSLLQT